MSIVQEHIPKLMAAEAKIRKAAASKPSNVNVADLVAESIIRDLGRILLKRLVDLRKMTADGFLVHDRINEVIEELLRWRAQAVGHLEKYSLEAGRSAIEVAAVSD